MSTIDDTQNDNNYNGKRFRKKKLKLTSCYESGNKIRARGLTWIQRIFWNQFEIWRSTLFWDLEIKKWYLFYKRKSPSWQKQIACLITHFN